MRSTRQPSDRRAASLTLTERGSQALEQLAAAHNTSLKRISPEIHGVTAAHA